MSSIVGNTATKAIVTATTSSSNDILDRIIDRLIDRAIEKVLFPLLDLLAPHAIDIGSNLFIIVYNGLNNLSEFIRDQFNFEDIKLIAAPEDAALHALSESSFNEEHSLDIAPFILLSGQDISNN